MTLPILYPMGAKTDKKRTELAWKSNKYFAERKYDGSRYVMKKENGKISFLSRQKSKQTGLPVDKTLNVPHLVESFSCLPDNTMIDGEIITHENCTSNDVTSIMGSLPERAIELQVERGWVKYVMLDILYLDDICYLDHTYLNRRDALEKVFSSYFEKDEHVILSRVEKVNKKEFHEEIVRQGGEGTILKNVDKPYVPDKKPSDNWIKVKKYDTYDVVVLGYTDATKEYTGKSVETWDFWHDGVPVTKDYAMGWIGAVRFGQWVPEGVYAAKHADGDIPSSIQSYVKHDGSVFHLVEIGQTDGLSDSWKEKFTHYGSVYLGKVMEVGAMEQIEKTYSLRHPRFIQMRDDKDSFDCIAGIY